MFVFKYGHLSFMALNSCLNENKGIAESHRKYGQMPVTEEG